MSSESPCSRCARLAPPRPALRSLGDGTRSCREGSAAAECSPAKAGQVWPGLPLPLAAGQPGTGGASHPSPSRAQTRPPPAPAPCTHLSPHVANEVAQVGLAGAHAARLAPSTARHAPGVSDAGRGVRCGEPASQTGGGRPGTARQLGAGATRPGGVTTTSKSTALAGSRQEPASKTAGHGRRGRQAGGRGRRTDRQRQLLAAIEGSCSSHVAKRPSRSTAVVPTTTSIRSPITLAYRCRRLRARPRSAAQRTMRCAGGARLLEQSIGDSRPR